MNKAYKKTLTQCPKYSNFLSSWGTTLPILQICNMQMLYANEPFNKALERTLKLGTVFVSNVDVTQLC